VLIRNILLKLLKRRCRFFFKLSIIEPEIAVVFSKTQMAWLSASLAIAKIFGGILKPAGRPYSTKKDLCNPPGAG
jgi:hypothetical protein